MHCVFVMIGNVKVVVFILKADVSGLEEAVRSNCSRKEENRIQQLLTALDTHCAAYGVDSMHTVERNSFIDPTMS
jgi:hypothetical protein